MSEIKKNHCFTEGFKKVDCINCIHCIKKGCPYPYGKCEVNDYKIVELGEYCDEFIIKPNLEKFYSK